MQCKKNSAWNSEKWKFKCEKNYNWFTISIFHSKINEEKHAKKILKMIFSFFINARKAIGIGEVNWI